MEWCARRYGIKQFAKGYSTHIFLPALPNTAIQIPEVLENCGAYVIHSPGASALNGVVIPRQHFNNLMNRYKHTYNEDTRGIYPQLYPFWLQSTWGMLGFNISGAVEHKTLNIIDIEFATIEHEINFHKTFQPFFIESSFNKLLGKATLQFSGDLLEQLQFEYSNSPDAAANNADIVFLQKQVQILSAQRQAILGSSSLFSFANDLAHSFSQKPLIHNTPDASQAIEAYQASLMLYGELYRDSLSVEEYSDLHYTSLQFGNLLNDVKLTNHLVSHVDSSNSPNPSTPLMKDFPNEISDIIKNDIANPLYGRPFNLDLPCLFPNTTKRAQTNEIVFYAGGERNNFTIIRIIKVGMSGHGEPVELGASALYFNYFKVEHNLAVGASGIDNKRLTCHGTVIRKLEPYNTNFEPIQFDIQNIPEYQLGMQFTIEQLLYAERKLLFYKKPAVGENSYPSNAPSEWERLNRIKAVLSGNVWHEPITYLRQDILQPGYYVERTITNQESFFEEGQNSALLSLKGYVESMMGRCLTERHLQFMRSHNASACYIAIAEKIIYLQNIILKRTPERISLNTQIHIKPFNFFPVMSAADSSSLHTNKATKKATPSSTKTTLSFCPDLMNQIKLAGNRIGNLNFALITEIELTRHGVKIYFNTPQNLMVFLESIKQFLDPSYVRHFSQRCYTLPMKSFEPLCKQLGLDADEIINSVFEKDIKQRSTLSI